MVEEKWSKKLDKAYPNIPSTDRAEIRRLCDEQSGRTTTPDMAGTDTIIRRYVLDRYTKFKSISHYSSNMEAVREAHQEASNILSRWRGKD
jgi:hypothetical protein